MATEWRRASHGGGARFAKQMASDGAGGAGADEAAAAFEAGQKMLRDAFSRMSIARDTEVARMRTELARRDAKIEELQKKVARLIDDVQKANQLNAALTNENARLRAFRQNILESLDDHDLSELRGGGTGATSKQRAAAAVAESLTSDAGLFAARNGHGDLGHGGLDLLSEDESDFELRPLSGVGKAPPASTTTRTSAPASAAPAAADGKEFFNNARARLSYDKFSTLLAHIQRYNRRERTKDETLDALATLLDGKHRDLYDQFAAMVAQ